MASVNKVILVGNLGRDPETRYMPSGDAITNVTIATTDSWTDKSTNEKREATEWHRISFFGKLAEIAGQYLKKGSSVYVEGSLRTRKWQDKDGQERYTTEIRADSMQMLGGKKGSSQGEGYSEQPRATSTHPQASNTTRQPPQNQNRPQASSNGYNHAPPQSSGFDDMDDDIPF